MNGSTIELNAAGARVRVRPAWAVVLVMFFSAAVYRIYWAWRTGTDIATFCRPRPDAPQGYEPIELNPTIAPLLLGISYAGWIALSIAAFPWGLWGVPTGDELESYERVVLILVGLALVVPGAIAILRLRRRIRHARTMAGLPADTVWTGRRFLPLVVCEVVTVPVWLFALQHSLNDLWSHYPVLHDEDLHGTLAPPATRVAAIARRPVLHQRRLERIAGELGDPLRTPWVTIGFAVLCVFAFTWQLSEHGFFPGERDIERVGGLRLGLDGVAWRFWAANVLHVSVEHVVGNMAVWAVIGTMVERAIGPARMIALVVVGAVGCSTGALIVDPHEVGVGASGVVFAAIGIAAMVDPLARRPLGRMGWLLAVVGLGFSTFVPGISSGGHVGGILAGATLGIVVFLVWKVPRHGVGRTRLTPVVDRSALLAPQRELSIAERLRHLTELRDTGALSPAAFARLEGALVARG